MIEMTCGAYGAKGRLIRPADGPFTLSAEEERRLVQRGVARYVQEKAAEPDVSDKPGDESRQEDDSVPPPEQPKKPAKAKKPGNPKEETPPDLSPEDPVE